MQIREGKISQLPSIPHTGVMGLINAYFEHIPNFSWTHPPRQTHDLVRAVVRGLLEGFGGKADKSGEIVLEMPDTPAKLIGVIHDLTEAGSNVAKTLWDFRIRIESLESGRQDQPVDTTTSVLEPLVARVAALEDWRHHKTTEGPAEWASVLKRLDALEAVERFPTTLETAPDTEVKDMITKLETSIKALEAEQARQEMALKALTNAQKAGRR